MVEIIPSINELDFAAVTARIRSVESLVPWVHLDVSDGVFTKHVSWHDPRDLVGFETPAKIEVHLMIDQPEKEIEAWCTKEVDRIIFHQEATKVHEVVIKKIRDAKKEVGIAIRPDTPWTKLFPFFETVDMMQLLAVYPGPSGQEFQEEILHKLGHIRRICGECILEIDGGVNQEVARHCTLHGANRLVAGNAIFGASDIKKAIADLRVLAAQETSHHNFFRRLLRVFRI